MGLVDKVLVEPRSPTVSPGTEAEEHEVIDRGDDHGLGRQDVALELGAVDAEVGDGGRVGETKGDLEFMARARLAFAVVALTRSAK